MDGGNVGLEAATGGGLHSLVVTAVLSRLGVGIDPEMAAEGAAREARRVAHELSGRCLSITADPVFALRHLPHAAASMQRVKGA